MQKFIARRMVITVFTVLLVSLIVFVMARTSGDPRTLLLDDYATTDDWDDLGADLGLDKPLFIQYGIFLKSALVLDLGVSVIDGQPVTETIMERFPATLQLGLAAFVFSMVLGIPLGILSSIKRDSVWDHVGKVVALLGQSMPPFWLGIMLMFFFAVTLGWVPPSGRYEWSSFILPAITLGWFTTAANMRLTQKGHPAIGFGRFRFLYGTGNPIGDSLLDQTRQRLGPCGQGGGPSGSVDAALLVGHHADVLLRSHPRLGASLGTV